MHYSEQFLGKEITIKMDRPMGSKHPKHGYIYPVNYGFVPNTVAPDGDEVDACLLGVFEPVESFHGTCIAIIRRDDDDDDKLIVVPTGKTFSKEQITALTEFQERFFKSSITMAKLR